MNVKRYFADNMPEAMEKIRSELGPDAVILSSKQIRKKGIKGLFEKPVLEVMVAYETPARAPRPRPQAAARRPALVPDPKPAPQTPQRPTAKPALATSSATSPEIVQTPARPAAQAEVAPMISQTIPTIVPQPMAKVGEAYKLAGLKAESIESAQATVSTPIPEPEPEKTTDFQAFQPTVFKPAKDTRPEAQDDNEFSRRLSGAISQKPLVREPLPEEEPEPQPQGFSEVESERLKQLDKKIEELNKMLSSFAGKFDQMRSLSEPQYGDEVRTLYERLMDNEVIGEVARAISDETQAILNKLEVEPREVMEQVIKQYIGETSTIKLKRFRRNVIILCGPTGVGKTTTLVKLAAYYTMKEGLKVGLINADTYRIAAQEQLKTYAEILEAPIATIYGPEELGEALREMEDRDVVFIDTSGKKPTDEAHKEEIRRFIDVSKADDVLLVMSAPTGNRACRDIIENYDFLDSYKLVLTKMDETSAQGIILNVCYLSQHPLAYLATGQSVPDDIEPADPDRIVESILGELN